MKTINLQDVIQQAAREKNSKLWLPGHYRTHRSWPICKTCGRDVDAAEVKNVNSKGCELWARCHGAEDYVRVVWGVPIRESAKDPLEDPNLGWAVRRAMGDWVPFELSHLESHASKR